MKLRRIIFFSYIGVFLLVLLVTKYFLKYMLFEQKTANIVMIVALVITVLLLCLNYLIMKPILKIIIALQITSQKNANGDFTILKEKAFASEIALLLNDYNVMVKQLEQQVVQIKAGEKEKNEIIANLSHDIKTPVASLTAVGQALSDDILDDDEKKYYLQAVLDNCHRIADLSDELAQFVEQESAVIGMCKDEIWLDEVLISVLTAFKGKIDCSQREILVEGTEFLEPIYSNESAIFRILYNVIDNSLKYSQPQTPIKIRVEKQPTYIRISIKDFGQGIAEAELEKIFQRTYRIEKSRNQTTGGNGLGLSIAKKLLENLGGNISVCSKEGEGSTFCIEVPYRV